MASRRDVRAGRAYVELYTVDGKLNQGLLRAQRYLSAFGAGVQAVGRKFLMLGTMAAVPFALATRVFAGFSDEMQTVLAVTGAVESDFRKLTATAKELGRTTSFTAGQVAAAMANLGRQGFSAEEIDASISSVLNLARATRTDLAEAANIASATLRAFSLDAKEMTRVADVLVATANNSAQTLLELGESMTYAAPIAEEYGLSIEQTCKALGVLANMGIKSSRAGTGMRQIMLSLADPAAQAQLRGVGVEALDATRNLRPLGDVMLDIGRAMVGMTNAQRLALGKELFDRRAMGAALKLAKTDFPALQKAIDNAGGTAARTAQIMDAEIGGAFRRLWSAAEGTAIAIGEGLSKEIRGLAQLLTQSAGAVTGWVKANSAAIIQAAKWAGVLVLAGGALMAVGGVLSAVAMALGIVRKALIGLQALWAAQITPMMLCIAAAAALVVYFTDWEAVLRKVSGVVKSILPDFSEFAVVARKTTQDLKAEHDQMVAKAQKLAELRAKQQQTNEEMAEASILAHDLRSAYPGLTREINLLGQSADVTADMLGKMNGVFRERVQLSYQEQIFDTRQEIAKLQKQAADAKSLQARMPAISAELNALEGSWRDSKAAALLEKPASWLFGTGTTKGRVGWLKEQRGAAWDAGTTERTANEKIALLQERLSLLTQTAQGLDAPPAAPGGAPAGGAPAFDATKWAEDNADLIRELEEVQARAIEDALQRDLKLLELHYNAKREAAKEANQDITLIDKAYLAEGAAIRKRYADEEDARRRQEFNRQNDEWFAFEESLYDDIALAEIDLMPDGLEKQLARINFDKTKAMKEALAVGADPAQINKLFGLREDIARKGAAKLSVTGTFSAAAASRLGGGGGKQLDKLVDKAEVQIREIKKIPQAIERHAPQFT